MSKPILALVTCIALFAATGASACNPGCATYAVTIVVEDRATGNLLCDAHVVFLSGDAGTSIDGEAPYSDAEAPGSSSQCQWDITVTGGAYQVTATAPGFKPGTATLQLQSDECGMGNAPVTVYLVRS